MTKELINDIQNMVDDIEGRLDGIHENIAHIQIEMCEMGALGKKLKALKGLINNPPIGGTYTLRIGDNVTAPIPYDATYDEQVAALEKAKEGNHD